MLGGVLSEEDTVMSKPEILSSSWGDKRLQSVASSAAIEEIQGAAGANAGRGQG